MNAFLEQLASRQLKGNPGFAHKIERRGRDDAFAIHGKIAGTDGATASARFVITSNVQDRSGDVVEPRGCLDHIDQYRANPVVFWCHKTDDLPIGICRTPEGELALEWQDDKILGTCFFHLKTLLSEQVYELVMAGVLSGASIGFVPLEGEKMRTSTIGDIVGYHITKWLPLEWSIVPLPDNQESLRASISRDRVCGKAMEPILRKALDSFVIPAPVAICVQKPSKAKVSAMSKKWKNGRTIQKGKAASVADSETLTHGKEPPKSELRTGDNPSPLSVKCHKAIDVAMEGSEDLPHSAKYLKAIHHLSKAFSGDHEIEQPDIKGFKDDLQDSVESLAEEHHPDEDFEFDTEERGTDRPDEKAEDEADTETHEGVEEDEKDEDIDYAPEAGEGIEEEKEEDPEEQEESEDDDKRGNKIPASERRLRRLRVKRFGSRYIKGMTRRQKMACKDAGEYLNHMGEHSELPKWMAPGHKAHGEKLINMFEGTNGMTDEELRAASDEGGGEMIDYAAKDEDIDYAPEAGEGIEEEKRKELARRIANVKRLSRAVGIK